MKVWLNGHEWAKRQCVRAGIGFSELSNGFAACDGPRLGCRRSATGSARRAIQVFFERWMSVLPLPLTPADRDAGYWWELSMRQIETSRTLVFDAPAPGPRRSSRPWSLTTSTSAARTAWS